MACLVCTFRNDLRYIQIIITRARRSCNWKSMKMNEKNTRFTLFVPGPLQHCRHNSRVQLAVCVVIDSRRSQAPPQPTTESQFHRSQHTHQCHFESAQNTVVYFLRFICQTRWQFQLANDFFFFYSVIHLCVRQPKYTIFFLIPKTILKTKIAKSSHPIVFASACSVLPCLNWHKEKNKWKEKQIKQKHIFVFSLSDWLQHTRSDGRESRLHNHLEPNSIVWLLLLLACAQLIVRRQHRVQRSNGR